MIQHIDRIHLNGNGKHDQYAAFVDRGASGFGYVVKDNAADVTFGHLSWACFFKLPKDGSAVVDIYADKLHNRSFSYKVYNSKQVFMLSTEEHEVLTKVKFDLPPDASKIMSLQSDDKADIQEISVCALFNGDCSGSTKNYNCPDPSSWVAYCDEKTKKVECKRGE